jgi:hypothetical protein
MLSRASIYPMIFSEVSLCTEFMTEDGLVDTRHPSQVSSCRCLLQLIMYGKLVQYNYMVAKCYSSRDRTSEGPVDFKICKRLAVSDSHTGTDVQPSNAGGRM